MVKAKSFAVRVYCRIPLILIPHASLEKMKFKFKIQSYQTESIENTAAILTEQPNRDATHYRHDLDRLQKYNVLDYFDRIIESYSNEEKVTTHIL